MTTVTMDVGIANGGTGLDKVSMQKRLSELEKRIAELNKAYYEKSEPLASDEEYDGIVREYRDLGAELEGAGLVKDAGAGDEVNLFSLGVEVGSSFNKIKHSRPMLSLANVFNEEELGKFVKRVNGLVEQSGYRDQSSGLDIEFVAETKIDGVSFSARYENGSLVYASTRGTGQVGEEVTENMRQIEGFPVNLVSGSEVPEVFEVRGEVYCEKQDFSELNELYEKMGQKVFANPRNFTSGSLRQLDPKITRERRLKYKIYGFGEIAGGPKIEGQEGFYRACKGMGLETVEFRVLGNSPAVLAEAFSSIEARRSKYNYDIDGVVYKVNSLELQTALGSTAHSPRWAIAHKFSSEKAVTTLEDVVFQVGRTGVVSPVAVLTPVRLAGVVVRRATLHNRREMQKLQIKVGDAVLVERAGDVIPKIVSVATDRGTALAAYCTACPSCGSDLQFEDVFVRCLNRNGCTEQIIGRIVYFASKDGLDIKELGERQIRLFYARGFIKTPADIFRLASYIEQVVQTSGWGKRSAANIMQSIDSRRRVSFGKFLSSLGILGVGKGVAKDIASHFVSIERLLASPEKSLEVVGVGWGTSRAVAKFVVSNFDFIQDLLSVVEVLPEKENSPSESGDLGLVVFTGKLHVPRSEAEAIAKRSGFRVATSVTKKVNYLVRGEGSGSKVDLANKYGVRVITEAEFLELTQKEGS